MDNYRGNDAEVDGIFDGESEDAWANPNVIRRITEDLREAYVLPLDDATQAKHLAAIADAISQNASRPRVLPLAQRPSTDGSRCASTFVRAAGSARVAREVSTASLASPFGARTAGTASAPSPRPRTSLAAVGSPPEPKTAHVSWIRPGAFVSSIYSKAAVIAAAIAVSASGLAIAGSLPDPVQTAFSEAAGAIGLDIPAPIQPPAVSPAPPREQAVATPVLPEPLPVVPQEPLPVPIVPPPAPVAEAPRVQAPPPAAQVAPPAAPAADLEAWVTELIRQALATANARAMNPQSQPEAGAAQSGQTGGQSWASENPWQSYATKGAQTNAGTGSGSGDRTSAPQAKPQSRPAAGSSYDD
jgi:hypothetical protein